MNETVVKSWFEEYSQLVESLGIADCPEHLWNCDETGVQSQFDQGLAIGEVGSPCYRITPGEKGETTTVLACFNAAGQYAPPMVIFKGKRGKSERYIGSPTGTIGKCAENGWINTDLLLQWARSFISSFKGDGLARLLLLDGHTTYDSYIKRLIHTILIFSS